MKKPANRLINSPQNRLTFGDATDAWLLGLRAGQRSERTVEFYLENIERFRWWLAKADLPDDVNAIEPSHIRLFIQYLQKNSRRWGSSSINHQSAKPLSDSSISAYFRTLRALFSFLEKEDYIELSPFADRRLPPPKVRDKVVPCYTEDEVLAILRVCQTHRTDRYSLRDTAILYVLFDCALRASEVCCLRLADLEKGRLKVLGKGNKERYVPMSPTTEKAVRDYVRRGRMGDSNFLFQRKDGAGLSYDGLKEIIRRRGRQAGVEGVKLHKFRHSSVLSLLKDGGAVSAVQALLGHTSPTMSLRYGRFAAVDVEEVHRRHSPVERLGKKK